MDQIVDVWHVIDADTVLKSKLESLITTEKTFSEIRTLIRQRE